MLNVLFLGLGLLLPAGTPREISSMAAIENVIDAETLVVFDIDNTLIAPTTELGSDQWFFFLIERFEQQGLSHDDAMRRANQVWNTTQWLVKAQAVEAGTPALIKRLQARKIRTMALTARDRASAPVTLAQLEQIGVRFADHAPVKGQRVYSQAELGGGEDGEVVAGVMLIGETNEKGPALARLIASLDKQPAKVVFVDDKLKHAVSVLGALEAKGIACTSFRYGAADARVERFAAVMNAAREADFARLFLTGELTPALSKRAQAAQKALAGEMGR